MKEKQYSDYTLDEKIIYVKGWNAAIKAAIISAYGEGDYNQASYYVEAIKKLDRSIQACDD